MNNPDESQLLPLPRRPIWKDIGWIGLISLVLSVYFWWDAKIEPDLRLLTSIASGSVISTESTPRLSLLHDGNPVSGSVVVQRVKIWNNGKRPIKAEDVLESVRIQITPQVRILEAKVIQVARPVSVIEAFAAGPGQAIVVGQSMVGDVESSIRVNWKILEKGDGAIVQIVYVGPKEVKLSLTGAIVGQSTFSTDDESARLQKKSDVATGEWKGLLFSLVSIGLVGFVFAKYAPRIQNRKLGIAFFGLTIVLSVGATVFMAWLFGPIRAPF